MPFQTLVTFGVTLASFASLLSILLSMLWVTPLAFYGAGLWHSMDMDDPASVQALWLLDVGTQVALPVFMVRDDGLFWPLRTVSIGAASFVTLTLPTLASFYVVKGDDVGTGITLGAFAAANIANAAALSILFELFHRSALRTRAPATAPAAPIALTMRRVQR